MSRPPAPDPRRTIWFQPQPTVRHLIATEQTQHVYPLAALAGVAQELTFSFFDAGNPLKLIFDLATGALFGVIVVFLGSALVTWLGGKLGGVGTWQALRIAVAWAAAPYVALIALLIPLQILFLLLADATGNWQLPLVRNLALFANSYAAALLVLNVREAHRLPLWKTLALVAVPLLILLLPLLAAVLIAI